MSNETTALCFARHRGPITSVASVPGTNEVMTAGYDSAVALFNLESRRARLLGYHRHLVNRVVVESNGARAATCSSDYSICLWSLSSARPIRVLLGHDDDVEDFAFIDARTGVSASRDHRAFVWDLASGAVRRVLEGHERDVLSVSCSGGQVYTSGDDMTLRVWDIETGALLRTWGPFEAETDTCAVDPERHRIVLGCDDGHIRIFDTRTGALVADVAGHSSGIKKVAVSPRLGLILSAAYDRRLLVWNPEGMTKRLELVSPPSVWERSLTWSSDGTRILAGTFDGTVVSFDTTRGELELEIGDEHEPGNACFNDVAVGLDGLVATVSDDGLVRLGRAGAHGAAWRYRAQPPSARVLMNAIAIDRAGARLATGGHDSKVHLFEIRADDTLLPVAAAALGAGPINTIRFANEESGHGGEAFVGCYSGDIVRVAPDGSIAGRIRLHDGAVKSLRLHPRRAMGISCGADGLLLGWSLDGRLLERHSGHTAIINDVDLEPEGDLFASVSRDFTLRIFEIASGKLVATIALGSRSLKSVCFWSRDLVFVGDYWGGILRVEPWTGRVRRKVVARNGISALGRSGSHLVAVSYEGCALLVTPDELSIAGTLRAMHQRLDGEWQAPGPWCPPDGGET